MRHVALRTLAVAALAGFSLSACTEGETRNAPDGTEPVTETPAPEGIATETSEGDRLRDATATPVTEMRIIPSTTAMHFTVDRAVSTNTDSVGSEFTASLVAPVFDDAGNEALPVGTQSRWVVTEASTEDGSSVLAFRLAAVMLHNEWIDMEATVTDASLDVDNADSNGETAAKIGIGAAAGAIVGQIIGRDTGGTLTGAGVGAAVGTAVALSTKGGHATLPAGSDLRVELDDPVSLR